jgi:hypothetical protein
MLQVAYCWILAILNFAFSAELGDGALGITAFLVAGYFTVMGALAGWHAARND